MGSGKRAAAAMDLILSGSDRFSLLRRHFQYRQAVPLEPGGGERHAVRHLHVADRGQLPRDFHGPGRCRCPCRSGVLACAAMCE